LSKLVYNEIEDEESRGNNYKRPSLVIVGRLDGDNVEIPYLEGITEGRRLILRAIADM
jgi:hypothetical protein